MAEVRLLTEGGPAALGAHIPLTASECITQAEGSMGLTGSCLGIVKYPLGFGSQHFATTSVIGLLILIVFK